jgi:hypothetical protein
MATTADMAGVSYPVVRAYVAERKTGLKLGEVGCLTAGGGR